MKKVLVVILSIALIGFITLFLLDASQVWGINKTVGWAWDITNYFFWVGFVIAVLIFGMLALGFVKLLQVLFRRLNRKGSSQEF